MNLSLDAASLGWLMGVVVLASACQNLTGFAFGLITMGGVGLTGLLSLPDAAMLVSVLTLVNATQMLFKGWRDVDWLRAHTALPLLRRGSRSPRPPGCAPPMTRRMPSSSTGPRGSPSTPTR